MANSYNAKNQAAAQDRSPAARRLEADLAATLDENQATNTRPAGIQSAADRWARRAGQIQFCFRFAAILFLACFLIGWPLGTSWAEYQLTGMFRFRLGFGLPVFLYMITVPILIFVIGYILSLGFRMAGKAEELEMSAARLYQPDAAGPQQAETAGAAVRGQIASLNSHLDEALGKLATVESMIRQQVKAIENAAAAMQDGTSSKAERVAAERQSLMELTETLNREAERFAEAIAEKAKLGLESSEAANSRIAGAERELESRLGRLEDTAGKALDAFERLAETIAEKETSIDAATARIDDATQRADEKSSHLAELMQQQQERADRLAAAIASQSEQTSTFDSAIEKLATIEGMIRTQVDAIDAAAEKIRVTSGESAQLVASEREQLIGLTEQLNQEAEQFAAALTRQAKAGIDGQADAKAQIAEAEADMKSRLGNIEQVSRQALATFDQLTGLLAEQESKVTSAGARLESASGSAGLKASYLTRILDENAERILAAQTRLETDSERLGTLITQQRDRADKLSQMLAGQLTISDSFEPAIEKLVSVEERIREQVKAIDQAATSITENSSQSSDRLREDRQQLLTLTEQLNQEAEKFAAALSRTAQAGPGISGGSDDQFSAAEEALTGRLQRLEEISQLALGAFDRLAATIAEREGAVAESAARLESIGDQEREKTSQFAQVLKENAATILDTQKRLEAEGARLDSLISSQMERTDRLAALTAEHGEKSATLDGALEKLAGVESMIQQQLTAINAAASAIRENAGGDIERLAQERRQLIEITENLNRDAENLASALGDKIRADANQAGGAAAGSSAADRQLDDRLGQMQDKAERALATFDQLMQNLTAKEEAVSETNSRLESMRDAAGAQVADVSRLMEQNASAIDAAQKRLAEESRRLEEMISDQRQRADRLAAAIAKQTEQLSALTSRAAASAAEPAAETEKPAKARRPLSFSAIEGTDGPDTDRKSKDSTRKPLQHLAAERNAPAPATARQSRFDKSWRDILAAADQSDELLTLDTDTITKPSAPKPKEVAKSSGDVISMVREMQQFMLDLEKKLYGQPQQAIISRFESGERNIFANIILRRDEESVKNRIRLETGRNNSFRKDVYTFLEKFDRLLEPATGEEDSDTLIDDYLGSPIGQVYLIVGSAMDYFS